MGSCPSWLFPLPLKMLGDLMKLWSFWEIQWIIQTHDRTIEVFHGIFNKHDEEGTSNSSGLWNCQLIQLQSLWHQEKHQLRFEHYEKKRKDQADSKSGCVFRWQSIKRSLRSMLYIYTYHFKDLCKHLEVKADPKTWRQVKVVLHSYVGVALSVFIKVVCMIFSHNIDHW